MRVCKPICDMNALLLTAPHAAAVVNGSSAYPDINGVVRFYQTKNGVLIAADIDGLPRGGSGILAFHIHSGACCKGTADEPFTAAGTHFNPTDQPHPYHAGDLPPLFVSNGKAFAVTLTDRFTVADIIGKTVIVHAGMDDFSTQPAGNAGEKIACGEIRQ